MADQNPYASKTHESNADQAKPGSFRIYGYSAIAFLILLGSAIYAFRIRQEPLPIGTIPTAKNGITLTQKDSAVMFVMSAGNDECTLTRQNGTIFSADQAIQASEIIDYLTEEFESGQNKNQVMILGDAEVKVAYVTRIQRIIGNAFEDVQSTFIAVREE